MKASIATLALFLVACNRTEPSQPPVTPPAPPAAGREPDRITVQHVLVAFKGADRAEESVTRTKVEAENLAHELLGRARKGEDIKELSKTYSNDPGGGLYTLVNFGVSGGPGDIPRKDFIKPFTDIAFALKVGEVGLVDYEPGSAGFGWHVIKRLE